MNPQLNDVVYFNGMVVSKRVENGLTIQSYGDRIDMQRRLIQEETKELFDALDDYAATKEGKAHIAKEICDLLYVVYGMCFHLNMDITPIWEEVHKNNVDKITRGSFRADGKLVKPEGFITYAPDQVPELYTDILDFVAPI